MELIYVTKYNTISVIMSGMRSLYVEDIPGAKPKRHVYNKKIYHQKLEEEITRFARFTKNPEEKRIIDWYVPPRKTIESIDKNDKDYWATKKSLLHEPGNSLNRLSKSMILTRQQLFGQAKKIQNRSQTNFKSADKNLAVPLNKSQLNPYFPHMYVETRMGQSNKWSGFKVWHNDPTKVIQLPSIDQCYFKKWD